MKFPVHLRVALCAALLPALASANDGIAGVNAGGIVFRKTDAIAMKKEVLTVSYHLITVDYEFLNESGADAFETIVFPLPAYSAAQIPVDTYYGEPAAFSIVVDGKPVAYTPTLVAQDEAGNDVTAALRKAGLSTAQIAYTPNFGEQRAPAPLSAHQVKRLRALDLMGDEDEPRWQVQVNYVWKQKFPANRIVRVHHAYRPFTEGGPGATSVEGDFKQRYCADPAFFAAWRKVAARNEGRYVPAAHVGYILKTGNTWKRGIEDFTLNIVKRDPGELVSLCFPGTVTKLDSKTYQVRLRNFQPKNDLEVYFGNVNDYADNQGRMPRLPK